MERQRQTMISFQTKAGRDKVTEMDEDRQRQTKKDKVRQRYTNEVKTNRQKQRKTA